MKRTVLAVLTSGCWIAFSEFLRNEVLFKAFWIEKYLGLGLEFPSSVINNVLWGVWSFLLAGMIVFLMRRLNSLEVTLVTWVMAFLMMWITIGNLNVLPMTLLIYPLPLSIIEISGAVLITRLIDHTHASQ